VDSVSIDYGDGPLYRIDAYRQSSDVKIGTASALDLPVRVTNFSCTADGWVRVVPSTVFDSQGDTVSTNWWKLQDGVTIPRLSYYGPPIRLGDSGDTTMPPNYATPITNAPAVSMGWKWEDITAGKASNAFVVLRYGGSGTNGFKWFR